MELGKCSFNYNHFQFYNNKGMVLIVALVFLAALTAVAAALMQITTTDLKMSDASQAKVVATQEAISSLDQVVYDQINTGGQSNGFAQPITSFPLNPAVTAVDTVATISVATPNNLVVECPHSKIATSVQVFKCNALQVQISRKYGRTKASTIQLTSGVSQQLLAQ